MYNTYYIKYTVMIKGEVYPTCSGTVIRRDDEVENKEYQIGWNELEDFYHEYGIEMPFNIWNLKKGRVISFFNAKLFNKKTWDICEWKENLDIAMLVEYKPITVSIDEILKYHNSEDAINYLMERGLSIINK